MGGKGECYGSSSGSGEFGGYLDRAVRFNVSFAGNSQGFQGCTPKVVPLKGSPNMAPI